ELQEMYQDMRYTLMSADEKTKNMRQLEQDILNVIHNNTHKSYHLKIDPLDLHTIVTLMNNHKTDPIILAYLHSYDTFPLGYPYKVSDYAGDDELLD
ncbi:MAG: hypothetical protein LBE37_16985, partial [Sphingobacterium sp.]|nr:hypothetical protein [Sphingobacterium sp.]